MKKYIRTKDGKIYDTKEKRSYPSKIGQIKQRRTKMNKELEALEKIGNTDYCNKEGIVVEIKYSENLMKEYNLIKSALEKKELYKIEFNILSKEYKKVFNELEKEIECREKLEKVWKPIKEYFNEQHDWVLVQFKEKKSGFLLIPKVCEYRKHKGEWHTQEDDAILTEYLNSMCEAVAFMEIPKYKEIEK